MSCSTPHFFRRPHTIVGQALQPVSLAEWTFHVSTADGVDVCVRPLRADDREREACFLLSLSERTRYFRLMTPMRHLSPHLLDQLMDVDYRSRMALVATIERDGKEVFIGVARYAEADEPGAVELGITIMDDWQHRGLARLLVTELMRYAHLAGYRQMIGMVLTENAQMLSFSRSLGFKVTFDPPSHLMRIVRDLQSATYVPGQSSLAFASSHAALA